MIEKRIDCKIVICDDDVIFLELLAEKIKAELDTQEIAGRLKKYSDGRELINRISSEDDLYFLDIDMPKVSGMELAEAVIKRNPKAAIIFASNHEEMVFDAIRYTPLRFIRKARVAEELPEALAAWRAKTKQQSKTIGLLTREGEVCVLLENIVYIESKGHYLQVFCRDTSYEMRGKISDYEKLLKEDGFVRVNISHIVNCRHIKALRTRQVLLDAGMEINIGGKRYAEVRHAYMEYVREGEQEKMQRVSRLIAMLAHKTALKTAGRASWWLLYQPREPEKLGNLKVNEQNK
mgnify:CR=1 FL=1